MNYDVFADPYNTMVKHGYRRSVHQYIIEQLRLETDLSEKSICDLGCGQGSLAAKVIAVDSSEKQLDYARFSEPWG